MTLVAPECLSFGFNRNVKIKNSLQLSYGIGFELFNFTFSHFDRVTEERILSLFEVIEMGTHTPGTTIETKVNEFIEDENDLSEFQGDIDYNNVALCLPFSLQYEVFSHFFLSGNLGMILPLDSKASGFKYNYNSGYEEYTTISNDKALNRVIYNAGIGVSYQIENALSIGLQFRMALNSVLATDHVDALSSKDLPVSPVNMRAVEVRMGYSF